MSLCAVYFRTSAIVALTRGLLTQEDPKSYAQAHLFKVDGRNI
jgi:hypothetical protein